VTIATNMAGRGTDIVLGGKLEGEATDKEKADWQVQHDKVTV
jgi:preprotein translocase subunit SecA